VNTHDDCRQTAVHLIAEHRRVHRMLNMARAAVGGWGGPYRDAGLTDVVQVLHHVRRELEHHFADEETGRYLEEVVSRYPQFAAEAHRIESEHPRLIESMDRLIAQAMDCDQSVEKRIALAREFDELCRQLDAHEAAENVLLRKQVELAVNVMGQS
jgi:hemerythrin